MSRTLTWLVAQLAGENMRATGFAGDGPRHKRLQANRLLWLAQIP